MPTQGWSPPDYISQTPPWLVLLQQVLRRAGETKVRQGLLQRVMEVLDLSRASYIICRVQCKFKNAQLLVQNTEGKVFLLLPQSLSQSATAFLNLLFHVSLPRAQRVKVSAPHYPLHRLGTHPGEAII